jgi:hypothetical protein
MEQAQRRMAKAKGDTKPRPTDYERHVLCLSEAVKTLLAVTSDSESRAWDTDDLLAQGVAASGYDDYLLYEALLELLLNRTFVMDDEGNVERIYF